MTQTQDCAQIAGFRCPVDPCPGGSNQSICSHQASLAAWRQKPRKEQIETLSSARPLIDPALRDAVNDCPFRGSILPLSLQDDCGCQGKELSECRTGRGAIPGRVTLRDCLKCQTDAS